VGKTTTASAVAGTLRSEGVSTALVSTDSFLLPNRVLADRGHLMEKGFPHTFDHDLAATTVQRLRQGAAPVEVPVYSHAVYDRVDGEVHRVEASEIVVIEGIYALQPAVAGRLHLGIYLDAPEELLRSWFVQRFLELCVRAETDPGSFYRLFVGLDPTGRREQAEAVWDTINGVNLREHILPTRDAAHLVVEKGDGHTVALVREQSPSTPPTR
jgi:type I pantothenate kinase